MDNKCCMCGTEKGLFHRVSGSRCLPCDNKRKANKILAYIHSGLNESIHLYNHDPICPYCGHLFTDAWDIRFDGEEVEVDCGDCDSTFLITRDVEISYSTSR